MKILVVQLKRIGDLMLTTPTLIALRKAYPEAEISLAAQDAVQELLPAIEGVNRTYLFKRKGGNAGFWGRLLLSNHDVCLDLTGNDRSALISVLSKGSRRIAFSRQKSQARRVFYNTFVDSPVQQFHTIDHYLHLLKPLGIDEPGGRPSLRLPDWALKKAQQILDARGVAAPFIAIHPGSARPEKYWVAERWAKVIDFCQAELKINCVMTGSAEAVESEHAEDIRQAMKTKCQNLIGKLDLTSLAALMQKSAMLLSVDSAAMHIGAAFEKPQIALFGRTNPFHWRPRHPNAIILFGGLREPMTLFQPKQPSAEVSEISTETVTGAITKLLKWPQTNLIS